MLSWAWEFLQAYTTALCFCVVLRTKLQTQSFTYILVSPLPAKLHPQPLALSFEEESKEVGCLEENGFLFTSSDSLAFHSLPRPKEKYHHLILKLSLQSDWLSSILTNFFKGLYAVVCLLSGVLLFILSFEG